MTAEQNLRDLTAQLEAAIRQAAEKRHAYRAELAMFNRDPHGYETLLRSALAYASAADNAAILDEAHLAAMTEVQYEQVRRENERRISHAGDLPYDVEMNNAAANGDEDARQWVYENLK